VALGYERKVIDRIVTPIPYNVDVPNDNDEGEVEVCIEEYVHKSNNSVPPLLRRVAVRSYVGTNADSDMEVLHASFSLTISQLPRNLISGKTSKTSHSINKDRCNIIDGVKDDIKSNNWLCWTKFQNHRGKFDSKTCSTGKSYLCVLTGPSTLKIFDVYPDPSCLTSRKSNGDEGSGGFGGEHTVSLPFEASSIFQLPEPYCGLLIQRADNGDEHVHYDEEYYPKHMKSNRSTANEDGGLHVDQTLQDNDITIEGPPSTIRLGVNNSNLPSYANLKPRGSNSSGEERNRTMNMSASSQSCSSSESNIGVQHPSMMNHTAPSLYTLHHPLDDIIPCITLPHLLNQLSDQGVHAKQSVWREKTNNKSRGIHFANVHEKVIFVGKPRCFMPYDEIQYGDVIVVTYNTQWKRHSFWILQGAPPPLPTLPLWKQTSHIMQSQANRVDTINTCGERNSVQNTEMGDKVIEENKVEPQEFEEMQENLSPLVARVSLTCMHCTNNESVDTTKLQSPVNGDNQEAVASEVFLATTRGGHGDFILCLLQPITNMSELNDRNSHVLRCFSLFPSTNSVGGAKHTKYPRWHVVGVENLNCLSAKAIRSTPIDPPSFLPYGESSSTKRYHAEWRRNFSLEPPIATDILLCRYSSDNDVHRTSLSLFRGGIHVVDCVLAGSPDLSSNVKSDIFFRPLGIKYSVGNRVDVVCSDASDSGTCLMFRVSLSLACKNSPLTEYSLLAIGSSIKSHQMQHNSVGSIEVVKSHLQCAVENPLGSLAFLFRADCARFSQLIALQPEIQEKIDDVEWYVFSSLIVVLFEFSLEGSSSHQLQLNNSLSEEGKIDYDDNSDGAWENLLDSEFHLNYIDQHHEIILLSNELTKTSSESDESNIYLRRSFLNMGSSCIHWVLNLRETQELSPNVCSLVFDSLHLLYEDMKLRCSADCTKYACLMGKLLYDLSLRSVCDKIENVPLMTDFVKYYERDLGDNYRQEGQQNSLFKRITTFSRPPCFHSLLEGIILGQEMEELFKRWTFRDTTDTMLLNGMCQSMGTLLHLFEIYFERSQVADGKKERDRALVMAMIQEGFTRSAQVFDHFPMSIAAQLIEVCRRTQSDPPPISNNSWTTAAYELVGRADLAQTQNSLLSDKSQISHVSSGTFFDAKDSDLVTGSMEEDDPENDGLDSIEKFSAMLFPNDNRVREAARLLRSSRPTFLRVRRAVEVSDHDYERQKQEKLSLLCRRVMALPLGRGMMTLGTLEPLPTEPLPIPVMCLAGRVPPRNATLALDTSQITADMKVWSEFHNGVAAGLRLPLSTDRYAKNIGEVARSWIVYNKPSQPSPQQTQNNVNQSQNPPPPNHDHGGFLLALGLRGHLSALSMTDVIVYLTQGSVTTAVGILLGMAANKRGTCDLSVSKMLCLHVPSLLPPTFASIDVASQTQAAAIAGIGLLYQGSSHRLMTEFLLNEIGKRPTNEQNTSDREGHTLCCGLALGMINLGLRNNQNSTTEVKDGLADLRIEERLHKYIVGGVDEIYLRKKSSGFDRMTPSGSNTGNDSERCSRIHEGDMINTDVTAPGAMLALGMIYLQSGNKSVAAQLALPDTHFSLNNLRPDFLYLSVVAKYLVLWDEVKPSENWIDAQMPLFVRKFYKQLRKKAEKASGLADLSTFAAMTVSEDPNDLHDSGGKHSIIDKEGIDVNDDNLRMENEEDHLYIDAKAIREAHSFIIAGACFSISLRFAGTGDKTARDVIFKRLSDFQKLRDEIDPISVALRPKRPVIEMCLGSTAIALSLVMAGTGDLKTLRLLKMLRWGCDDGAKYGSHMAFAAAIGMLFLGGGTCTIGRQPEDIAALIMAFFPRFPISMQDNQYHLQALRHIYALAVKHRKVEAIDIDNGEKVFVPIEVEYMDSTVLSLKTPCLLLNRCKVSKISVKSNRYFPVEVDFESVSMSNSTMPLFVKKRSGHLSYVQDPHGLRSVFLRRFASHNDTVLDLIYSTAAERELLVCARYLCETSKKNRKLQQSTTSPPSVLDNIGAFFIEILCESLLEEKTDVLPLQLALYDAMMSVGRKHFPTKIIWDLRLLRSLYESKRMKLYEGTSYEVVNPRFVAILCQRIDRFFSEKVSRDECNDCDVHSKWLGAFSIWRFKAEPICDSRVLNLEPRCGEAL